MIAHAGNFENETQRLLKSSLGTIFCSTVVLGLHGNVLVVGGIQQWLS